MKSQAPEHASPSQIQRLVEIMARLRDKKHGCPWDIEQTFETILPYTLEEAYEVADAIQRQDMAALKEELGDLLLQVVFHSQMASETGTFHFEEVAEAMSDKMLRRHAHVFAGTDIKTAQQQTEAWEEHKKRERTEKQKTSTLDDVPHAFPALLRAQKLQKRAAKTGFDWPTAAPIFDKIEEEILEVHEALSMDSPDKIEEEIGDLLFAVVNLARHLNIDAESALRHANHKFENRFTQMEQLAKKNGQIFDALSLDEQELLWNTVKHA